MQDIIGNMLNNTPDTENRNVFGIFLKKIKKSFEKGVDICVVMVYNVVTEMKERYELWNLADTKRLE